MEQNTNRRHAATIHDALRVSDAELEQWLNARAGDGEESRHAA